MKRLEWHRFVQAAASQLFGFFVDNGMNVQPEEVKWCRLSWEHKGNNVFAATNSMG
jgi:hypothetical protein